MLHLLLLLLFSGVSSILRYEYQQSFFYLLETIALMHACRHFGSTFPKSFTRCKLLCNCLLIFLFLFTFLLALVASGVYAATSSQAPFELVLAANPLVITSFLPFASPAIHAHNCDTYTLLTIVSS